MSLIAVHQYTLQKLPPMSDPSYHLYHGDRLICTGKHLNDVMFMFSQGLSDSFREMLAHQLPSSTQVKITVSVK